MDSLFTRSQANPILMPNIDNTWESKKVYNCGAVYSPADKSYHLFYRAVGEAPNKQSVIGHAISFDGEHFQRFNKPLLKPELPLEKRGMEDPRVTKVGNVYYMSYTAYDGDTARLFLASSSDLHTWTRHGDMMPDWDLKRAKGFMVPWDEARRSQIAHEKWIKAGGIFPEKIGNEYWMLFGDSNMWLAHSKDGKLWTPIWEPFIRPRQNAFDAAHVEMGPPPIKTEQGWLVLYHGIDNQVIYSIGLLLLALDDPGRILFRSEEPLLYPSAPYELSNAIDILPGILKIEKEDKSLHFNPKAIFICGAVVVDEMLHLYYGVGDSAICTAKANLHAVLATYTQ